MKRFLLRLLIFTGFFAGLCQYSQSQVYNLKGSGYNIWFNKDEFQYAYKKIAGDFILTANFEFVGQGVDPHRKIGWMVRANADAEAAHYSAALHGDFCLRWRYASEHLPGRYDAFLAVNSNVRSRPSTDMTSFISEPETLPL